MTWGNNPSAYVAPAAAGASSSFFGATAAPMMILGAISSAYGAYSSARSQRLQLDLQADLSRINARMAESSAQSALLTGQRQEQSARLSTAKLKAGQRVAMAANGIDLASQTAANVLTSTDVMGAIDANTIAANAVRAAWGYRTQAVGAENQARMSQAGASSVSPAAAGAASLLTSATSTGASLYAMKKAGA